MTEEIGGRGGSQNIRDSLFAARQTANRDTPQLYEFGPFRLEPAERKLFRGNEVVVLTPKAFDMLVLLVRNSGHLLEKEELVRMLWPDTFVGEGNLSNNIFLLRKALGEDPPYIETVPKRGYRFVGAVRQLPNAVPLRLEKPLGGQNDRFIAPVESLPLERSRLRRGVVVSAGLLLAMLLLLIGFDVGGSRRRLLNRTGPTKIQSLAVLPLTNLSGDQQQEYFADGMTEELITELSRIGTLRIISSTSVMRYKSAKKPLPQIARELGVDGIISGSVEREGGQVRITAQLIDGASGRNLWAESYQRDLRDVLTLEDEVARAIASEIRIKLTPQEQSSLARARPVNPEAYDAFLKGNYYTHQLTQEGMNKGVEYFERAIALDPNYAEPYDALSYNYQAIDDWTAAPIEIMPKAEAAVKEAIQLDDTLAQAHTDLATAYFWYEYNFPAAESEFKRATELNPNDVVTAYFYGWYLISMGRTKEGIAESKRGIEPAPLDLNANNVQGLNLYHAHQYDAAILQLRATLALQPASWYPHVLLGWCYEQIGKLPEAMAEFQKARQLEDAITLPLAALGRAYALAGSKSEAIKVIEELNRRARRVHVSPYHVAIIYAGLGLEGKAMEWLEKAYEGRSWYLSSLSVDPKLDNLRSDPHFQDLTHRIGFPQWDADPDILILKEPKAEYPKLQ